MTKSMNPLEETTQPNMVNVNHKSIANWCYQSVLHIFRQNPNTSYTIKQICTMSKVHKKAKTSIKKCINKLCKEHIIEKTKSNCYRYITRTVYIGKVDYVHPKYAYIIVPQQNRDILVTLKNLQSALHHDLVKVEITKHSDKRPEGKVIEIVQRNPNPIIGKITKIYPHIEATVEQKNCTYHVILEQDQALQLQCCDKVSIQLSGSDNQKLRGKVIKNFGQSGLHEVEMQSIIAEFGLPTTFSDQALEELKGLPTDIPEAIIHQRKDFRDVLTCTIDPDDAKDFDDALSYQKLDNGTHRVGIHIADVSYYIKSNMVLDQEAYQRNTSVYLIDRCIPMLPELVSNHLCSLRPNEDKLTFSAVFELDDHGKVHKRWFGETIIHSNKRFTYQEAQMVLDNKTGSLYHMLDPLNRLAKALYNQRINRGSIDLETQELSFKLDEEGNVLDIYPKTRTDAHKLIEEFMLLANREVASYVANIQSSESKIKPAFIYRIHNKPDKEKIAQLINIVKQLGYPVKSKSSFHKLIEHLKEDIQGTIHESIIQTLIVRSMAKAVYSTKCDPHFALAFPHYCHFTSPIRRYPDLIIHRLLKAYLQGHLRYNHTDYEKYCQYAIERESIAASAERASVKYKQIVFIQEAAQESWQGIITSMSERCMYIELEDNACEGMLKLSDMPDDFYVWDKQKNNLTGRHTKVCYRIGDIITVKIKGCHPDKRQVDFLLA